MSMHCHLEFYRTSSEVEILFNNESFFSIERLTVAWFLKLVAGFYWGYSHIRVTEVATKLWKVFIQQWRTVWLNGTPTPIDLNCCDFSAAPFNIGEVQQQSSVTDHVCIPREIWSKSFTLGHGTMMCITCSHAQLETKSSQVFWIPGPAVWNGQCGHVPKQSSCLEQ